jgi:hypothetical protein
MTSCHFAPASVQYSPTAAPFDLPFASTYPASAPQKEEVVEKDPLCRAPFDVVENGLISPQKGLISPQKGLISPQKGLISPHEAVSGRAVVGVGALGRRLEAVAVGLGLVVAVAVDFVLAVEVGVDFVLAVEVGVDFVLAVEAGVDLVLVAEGLLALEAEDAWACTARRETPAIAARAMEL